MKVEESGDALLRAGSGAIARWRNENHGMIINARSSIISDLDLSGADLSSFDLRKSLFLRCDMSHVRFANCNLNDVTFEDCRLDNADFRTASTRRTQILARSIDGARFGVSPTLGRLANLAVSEPVRQPLVVERSALPWVDRWLGWDRLRALAAIRIFVPAYVSLTLTVLYLNALAWYNSAIDIVNATPVKIGRISAMLTLPHATPSWTQLLVLFNFVFLAIAATSLLGCPARIVEFSREKWCNELNKTELFYDFASWQKPVLRVACSSALLIGGALSSFLLIRAVIQQAAFILQHIG